MFRTLLPLVLVASACQEPAALPWGDVDASGWFDVALPSTFAGDGYVLTQIAADGGVTAVDPSAGCPEGATDGGGGAAEAAVTSGDGSAGAMACPTPLGPGDVVFDEVMISSVAGSSDRGQWLEVRSTRSCMLDLIGLHASAPHGQSFHTMDVTTDTWLEPGGFFLIADSTDPTENGGLPGLVLAWTGSPADALHKTSDTVTLSVGTTILDSLTYPSKKRTVGTSMAFPADCSPSLRTDFASWKASTASWAQGLFGTPAAPNTDVTCALAGPPTCPSTRRRGR